MKKVIVILIMCISLGFTATTAQIMAQDKDIVFIETKSKIIDFNGKNYVVLYALPTADKEIEIFEIREKMPQIKGNKLSLILKNINNNENNSVMMIDFNSGMNIIFRNGERYSLVAWEK